MPPLRPTDAPGALVQPPTPHQYLEPDRSGRPIGPGEQLSVRYAGAGAAAVLDGRGGVEVLLNGEWINTFELDGPRLYEIVDTGHHQRHELTLVFEAPATAYAFSFAARPGAAPAVGRRVQTERACTSAPQKVIQRPARRRTPRRGRRSFTRLEGGSRSVSGDSRPDNRDGR